MNKIIFGVIAVFFARSVLAGCPSSVEWAESFFKNHRDFYYTNPAKIESKFSTEFLKLLKKDAQFTENHTEIGALDYDPWLGAQDGEIGSPLVFKAESKGAGKVEVSMSYPFLMGQNKTSNHTVRLVIHGNTKNCWVLHDFITPLGDSLSHLYSSTAP